jgi:antitoxin component YwqK of YwqJK toxin-antitoxin module
MNKYLVWFGLLFILFSCNQNTQTTSDNTDKKNENIAKNGINIFYHNNGMIKSMYQYKQDVLVGYAFDFYDNGKLFKKREYNHGNLLSALLLFETGDTIRYRRFSKDGMIINIEFNENKNRELYENYLEKIVILYYEDGSINKYVELNDDNSTKNVTSFLLGQQFTIPNGNASNKLVE